MNYLHQELEDRNLCCLERKEKSIYYNPSKELTALSCQNDNPALYKIRLITYISRLGAETTFGARSSFTC